MSLLPQNGEARRWRARVATWLVETARCIKRMEDIRECLCVLHVFRGALAVLAGR